MRWSHPTSSARSSTSFNMSIVCSALSTFALARRMSRNATTASAPLAKMSRQAKASPVNRKNGRAVFGLVLLVSLISGPGTVATSYGRDQPYAPSRNSKRNAALLKGQGVLTEHLAPPTVQRRNIGRFLARQAVDIVRTGD